MTTPATSTSRRAILLAVLVGALFVGLVGMHHLTAAPPGFTSSPSMAVGHPEPGQDGPEQPSSSGHDHHEPSLLHLCLAVLTAVGALVVVLLLWRSDRPRLESATEHGDRPRPSPRAPPPTSPARLALLCVLRT